MVRYGAPRIKPARAINCQEIAGACSHRRLISTTLTVIRLAQLAERLVGSQCPLVREDLTNAICQEQTKQASTLSPKHSPLLQNRSRRSFDCLGDLTIAGTRV